jgi:hypothetical protein
MSFSLIAIEGAAPYLEEELEKGRGLAQLARRLDLQDGHLSAFVPDGRHSLASQFRTGALRDSEEEAQALHLLTSYLMAEHGLSTEPRKLLISQFADGAEVPGGEPSDPFPTVWLQGARHPYQDGELWYQGYRASPADVEDMLGRALWFPAVGVVLTLPEGTKVEAGQCLDYEILAGWMQRPDVVLVGGWDAMNYLIWTPKAGSSP